METKTWALSKKDTLALKGIAIVAMLFHHLYFSSPSKVETYEGVLRWLGDSGKVCVSLFLFCSGYGLAVQYRNVNGLKGTFKFTMRRLVSLYFNYWVVFFIFVPISILAFNRPLSAAYGQNFNVIRCLGLDLLGLQGFRSYNITWWFNKLIIVLYLLFPVIYLCSRKSGLVTLLISLAICRFWMQLLHFVFFNVDLYIFQLPFVLGILWEKWEDGTIELPLSKHKNTQGLTTYEFFSRHRMLFMIGSLLLFACMMKLRTRVIIPHWTKASMDGFVSVSIVLIVISILRRSETVMRVLSFLGKHSMNVYLIHTFFNGYWFPSFFHTSSLMRSGCNFFVLLVVCLAVSMALEFVKEKTGIYRLLDFVKLRLK